MVCESGGWESARHRPTDTVRVDRPTVPLTAATDHRPQPRPRTRPRRRRQTGADSCNIVWIRTESPTGPCTARRACKSNETLARNIPQESPKPILQHPPCQLLLVPTSPRRRRGGENVLQDASTHAPEHARSTYMSPAADRDIRRHDAENQSAQNTPVPASLCRTVGNSYGRYKPKRDRQGVVTTLE